MKSLLPLALLLLAALPAAAAPGDDSLLALSWQPAFCEANRHRAECRDEDPGGFAAGNLALHGLWPQGRGSRAPAYCGVPDEVREKDRTGRWHELPPVPLSPELRREVDRVMPGARSHLDRHEWIKHGTCSGLSADDYFRESVELVEAAAGTRFGRLLTARVGGTVTVAELCEAMRADFGEGFEDSVHIHNSGRNLSEIRILLDEKPGGDFTLGRGGLADGRSRLRCDGSDGRRELRVDPAG